VSAGLRSRVEADRGVQAPGDDPFDDVEKHLVVEFVVGEEAEWNLAAAHLAVAARASHVVEGRPEGVADVHPGITRPGAKLDRVVDDAEHDGRLDAFERREVVGGLWQGDALVRAPDVRDERRAADHPVVNRVGDGVDRRAADRRGR